MPRYKKVYAWMDGASFFASLQPRSANGAANSYDNPADLLRDAHQRKMQVEWDDPAAVDAFMAKR